MGRREDVLYDCGHSATCVHEGNDVGWYYDDDYSWGFAPAGVGVYRYSCDYDNETGDEEASDQRMCWHTSGGSFSNGYRCGDDDNSGSEYERVVYQARVWQGG